MTYIKVTNTSIEGLYIVEPTIFEDLRGSIFEAYNNEAFKAHGMPLNFVQDNEVISKQNVLRGMHLNIKHPQGKLIRVIDGKILDVVIDLRRDSKTYMNCFSVVLSSVNKKQLYIPEGIGHGYLALFDSRVIFKTTTHYIPNDELCFSWKSSEINIKWPIDNPIQNERDKCCKELKEIWR